MSELIEFLYARIRQDELHAADAGERAAGSGGSNYTSVYSPARLLREAKAKRAIIDMHFDADSRYCRVCGQEGKYQEDPAWWPCPTILALASIYSDHPDYRAEWT